MRTTLALNGLMCQKMLFGKVSEIISKSKVVLRKATDMGKKFGDLKIPATTERVGRSAIFAKSKKFLCMCIVHITYVIFYFIS